MVVVIYLTFHNFFISYQRSFGLYSANIGIHLVRSSNTLLCNLPKLGHVHATRYTYARLADGSSLGCSAASLLCAGLGVFKRAFGDD